MQLRTLIILSAVTSVLFWTSVAVAVYGILRTVLIHCGVWH